MAGRDPLTPTEAIRWRCFDLTYAATLLGRGYGFREEAAAVEFLGEIEGNEVRTHAAPRPSPTEGPPASSTIRTRVQVEWTRGALLAHLAGGNTARGAPPLAERLGALLVLALAVAALCLVYRRRCAPRAGGHPPYGRLDEFTRR